MKKFTKKYLSAPPNRRKLLGVFIAVFDTTWGTNRIERRIVAGNVIDAAKVLYEQFSADNIFSITKSEFEVWA